MKITFVTSFSEEGYNTYAKKMLESVKEHWHPESRLVAFYHDFEPDLSDFESCDILSFRNLNEVEDLVDYKETFKKYDGNYSGQYNWRMDAIKWCHKVFAMSELAFEMAEDSAEAGWLVWLDADTVTTVNFNPVKDLEKFLPEQASIVHLGRTAADYSETSFIGFNLNRENPLQLIADLRGAYMSGEVLGYREWHDGFIFERLLNIYRAHGTNTLNLTPEVKDLDAFGVSPLSQWMVHYKGNKKTQLSNTEVAPDVNGPKRYAQLLKIVQHYSPKTIAETGTWNGGRAIQMAEAAFTSGQDAVHYIGYDLFEEATEESDKRELNTKAHNSLSAVHNRLEEYAKLKDKEGKKFTFTLHKGDTNETLAKNPISVDLAYIDGGHSYETTKCDYDHIDSDIVVFDDFFSEDSNGNKPAEEGCGTNTVISEIIEEIKENDLKYRIKVLPSQDGVTGGGLTHLAVVLKDDNLPALPNEFSRVPIVVSPRDCMPDDYILNNVKTNTQKLDKGNWLTTCGLTEDHLLIVSGGDVDYEQLRITYDNLKADGKNPKIACVKHSYPKLLKHKFKPDYCIVLDPRPIDGISTHGVKRSDLFKKINKSTLFLVASMTDTSVVDYLVSKDANIKLWHAYSEALRDKTSNEKGLQLAEGCGIPAATTFVTGGTCAAMRTYGMFHVLGFRSFHLFGFDCSVGDVSPEMQEEKLDTGQQKYFKVEVNDEIFWTTGELLAMAQDVEKLLERTDIDSKLYFYEPKPSLAGAVWRTSSKYKEISYEEII